MYITISQYLSQALGLGTGDAGESNSDEEAGEETSPSCAPPPAYPALQARRDSVRGWLCALYAFAAPIRCVRFLVPRKAMLVCSRHWMNRSMTVAADGPCS